MGFIIFLVLIVVLGAAVYGTAIYLTRKQNKVIEELSEKKDKLMAVPIADTFYTLKNLNLTGQRLGKQSHVLDFLKLKLL